MAEEADDPSGIQGVFGDHTNAHIGWNLSDADADIVQRNVQSAINCWAWCCIENAARLSKPFDDFGRYFIYLGGISIKLG